VKSVNRRFGTGGASRAGVFSIWSGLGWLSGPAAAPVWEAPGKEAALFGLKLEPCGVLKPLPMLDSWTACVRQADRASHNPPAASSAAIANNRCFAFIVFLLFDSSFTFTFATALCAVFRELAFDLERRRGILVRSASEQE